MKDASSLFPPVVNEAEHAAINEGSAQCDPSFLLPPSSFVEFGFARQDELDIVLRVMCAAFELPYEVARPIYYADPYFDAENKRVLRVDGRIVSCLTLSTTRCRIGKAEVKIAGITGVATLPEQQRRGYASRLIIAALQTLQERGEAFTGLFPYDYDYYRRLGWEIAGVGCKVSHPPAQLLPDAIPEAESGISTLSENEGRVCPAGMEHLEGIARVYERCAGEQALWAFRDAKRWQYVFNRIAHKYVYLNSAETVEGYLLYDIQPGIVQMSTAQLEQPPTLNIMELCAGTAGAKNGLMTYLAAQRQFGKVEYVTTSEHLEATGLMNGISPPQTEAILAPTEFVPALMLRIVNFTRLLQALRVNWDGFQGTIRLTLHDDVFTQSAESVVICGTGLGLPVLVPASEYTGTNAVAAQMVKSPVPSAPDFHITGDVRAWSQVAGGYVSGDVACANGQLIASAPESAILAGVLFPARSPFLPAPDHF